MTRNIPFEVKSSPKSVPLVHNEETTQQKPPQKPLNKENVELPNTYHNYLVNKNPDKNFYSEQFYKHIDSLYDTNYSSRLSGCSGFAFFAKEVATNKIVVLSSKCKLRFCPLCVKRKTNLLSHNVSDWLKKQKRAKLLTLTLVHSNAPLGHQIKNLYKHFKNFRRLTQFKDRVRGGVWFFQVTFNSFTRQYHPHLHCLLDSDFIAHHELSTAWLRTTASSKVVDVRTINDIKKVADYVARYAACPLDISKFEIENYTEIHEAFRGLRICGTWGTAKEIALSMKCDKDDGKFKRIGSWSVILELCKTESYARELVKCFVTSKPFVGEIDCGSMESFIDGKIDIAFKQCKQLYLDYG